MAFESGISDYLGDVKAVIFEGTPVVPIPPNNIVRTNEQWGVHIEWTMSGANRAAIEAIAPNAEFRLQVFLERIGPGAEITLPVPNATENILGGAVGPAGRTYTRDLQFGAGSVPDGTYHLTTMVQLFNAPAPAGTPQPAAGFIELPMVLFYNP